MFRNHARKLVIALALCAVVGGSVPNSYAAAASVPAAEAVADVHWEVTPVKPRPTLCFPEMSVNPLAASRNGKITYYTFRIQAEECTLKDVTATAYSSYRFINTNGDAGYSANQVESKGTFWAPDYRDVHLTCNPPPGTYCSSGWVTVTTSNGLSIISADDTDGNKV